MENKFRLWDKKMKEMHYFDFNHLCGYEELPEVELMSGENTSGVYLRDGFHLSTNTNDRKGELCPWVEIMQYTGLRDKHGKEIYEGDIIRYSDDDINIIGEVRCAYLGNTSVTFTTSRKTFSYPLRGGQTQEVIGNIYQDSHLLN